MPRLSSAATSEADLLTASGAGQFNYVDFINPMQGLAVGSNPTVIVRTDNGGTTWTESSAGTNSPLLSVSFADENNAWICGVNGTILHSDNDGDSWSAEISGTDLTINSIFFRDISHGWAVGEGGIILRY